MNFGFSADAEELRAHASRFLASESPPAAVRRVIDGATRFDKRLWQGIAALGWQGAAIPQAYGGSGMGKEALCVLAEELGASLCTAPFSSSIYLAAEAILLAGTEEQRRRYLPRLADGTAVGTFAFVEGDGEPDLDKLASVVEGGLFTGAKLPVLDGGVADIAVIVARDAAHACRLYVADLAESGVTRQRVKGIDLTRDVAALEFRAVAVDQLGPGDAGSLVDCILDQAATFIAFEQLGGARQCLRMACDYATQRRAFGRPIGSFQGIKHALARVFIALESARSNAYYAMWAMMHDAPDFPAAACAARISASDAFEQAAHSNFQVHAGMGYTWESDCHLFLRRAKLLSLCIGTTGWWKNRLARRLLGEGDVSHGS